MNLHWCLILLICATKQIYSFNSDDIDLDVDIDDNLKHGKKIDDKFERYQFFRELKEYCRTTSDCRTMAYICRKELCECAQGYKPDEMNKTCVGAIGRRCMYDSHCIKRAYCKGQTTCTCKEEFSYASDDKWSCEDEYGSVASCIQISSILKLLTGILLIYYIVLK